ncbi:MAG: hypothetical protein HYU64_06940 [Armatimonadetes bacterium]|nr:hypothetical protein [Armatimonadota bacterium]
MRIAAPPKPLVMTVLVVFLLCALEVALGSQVEQQLIKLRELRGQAPFQVIFPVKDRETGEAFCEILRRDGMEAETVSTNNGPTVVVHKIKDRFFLLTLKEALENIRIKAKEKPDP